MSSNDQVQSPERDPLRNLKQFSYKKSPMSVEAGGSRVVDNKDQAEDSVTRAITTETIAKEQLIAEEKTSVNKRNRIVSDTDSESDVKDIKPALIRDNQQTQQLPTTTECNNDVKRELEQADLKSRIRTTYSTISKSSDIVASFNNSPSSSKNDLMENFSMVSFKRKRPVIFSSDDDDDDDEKKKAVVDAARIADSKVNGESVKKDKIGETSCKIAKAAIKRNSTSAKGVEEREKCLSVLRRMFPVLDYMECQEVLAVNSWSLDESIKFLDALPNEEIDDCLSATPDQDHVIQRGSVKNNRIRTNGMKQQRRGVRFISDSDSDEEVVYRIKAPSSEDRPHKEKKEKPDSQKRKKKRKKLRTSGGSDSGDSYDRMQDVIYDSDASDDDDTLTPARNVILEFYQTAKMEELLVVPGCSKKKANVIVESRPFSGWLDLVCKFRSGKGLSTDLLNNAKDSLNSQRVVTKLMQNCEQLAKRMESQVARLMNEANFDEDEGHLKKQPSLLNPNCQLTSYQLLGVNWLLLLHRQKVNGILADEMGLGKTIQATAFLTHLLEEGDEGPHLIVVPASTVDNWVRELNTWSPKLQVLVYQGNQVERKILRNRILTGKESSFNIIVATYNLVTSSPEDRSLFRRIILRYVIFDEAHLLKNMETQRYQNLMKINAKRRLLLTGTPLQNNLVELMSLLVFVMPNMFDGKREHLKIVFSMASKDDREETKGLFEKERISHAKQIMKPFVLRRLKVDVLRYLPKKAEEVEHCAMSDGQQRTYNELVSALARQAREDKERAMTSGGGGMAMVMQLRKLANHPLLMRYHFTEKKLRKMAKLMLKEPTHRDAQAQLIFEDMQVMSDFELHKLCGNFKSLSSFTLDRHIIIDSGKFSYLDSALPVMKSNGHRILLFSQFVMVLDIVEEYMKIVGHNYIRLDGSTPVSDRLELIDRFTNDASIFVFLLSTKAGGLGINLTAANTVILHDIDFNPYNDKQAEDRCHRVGQTKDVRVIRLISKDTIEEDILRMATKKLKLEQDLVSQESDLDDGDSKNVASLLKQVLKL